MGKCEKLTGSGRCRHNAVSARNLHPVLVVQQHYWLLRIAPSITAAAASNIIFQPQAIRHACHAPSHSYTHAASRQAHLVKADDAHVAVGGRLRNAAVSQAPHDL